MPKLFYYNIYIILNKLKKSLKQLDQNVCLNI